jgi:hypothetical protein
MAKVGDNFPSDVSIRWSLVRRVHRDENTLIESAGSRERRKERDEMRVMVLVKASPESEAGALPSTEVLDAMSRFNDELVNAGVLLAADRRIRPQRGVAGRTASTDSSLGSEMRCGGSIGLP